MVQITSLAKRLKNDSLAHAHLADLAFVKSGRFSWNHQTCSISYDSSSDHADLYLLHEYAHAVLGHEGYARDISLLELESDAWDTAERLAPIYEVRYDSSVADESLDTYRDWLHARSLCPNCESTGVQSSIDTYRCIACGQDWKVNQARNCELRRYKK